MKKLNFILLTFVTSLSLTPCFPVAAQSPKIVPTDTKTAIEPLADILEYYYKVIDGVTYRRLWNSTKQEWIGDWEVCP